MEADSPCVNIGIAFLQLGRAVGGVDDLPVPARDGTARFVEFDYATDTD